MSEQPGVDGVDPARVSMAPVRPRTTGEVAVGRVLLGVGDIIEGKPPREAYVHIVESDQPGEPEDPESLTINL
jgi:hypothetical protein